MPSRIGQDVRSVHAQQAALEDSRLTTTTKKKEKKAKNVKVNLEGNIEREIEPLVINTSGYCSCPVPILKTPPDQQNGSIAPSDNESPVKKKKKAPKEKVPTENNPTVVEGLLKTFSEKSPKKKKKRSEGSPSTDRPPARKRCNECTGCKAEDCGQCAPCKDKKKFGGPNVRKQACKMRRCISLYHCAFVTTNQLIPSAMDSPKQDISIPLDPIAAESEVTMVATESELTMVAPLISS